MVLPPNVREEGVRSNGRERLTNAWIVGILRGDKGKRVGSDRKSSCKSFSLGKSWLEFGSKLSLVSKQGVTK